jgi:uncharacterized protein YjgD (DUF1641 family)
MNGEDPEKKKKPTTEKLAEEKSETKTVEVLTGEISKAELYDKFCTIEGKTDMKKTSKTQLLPFVFPPSPRPPYH